MWERESERARVLERESESVGERECGKAKEWESMRECVGESVGERVCGRERGSESM